MSLVPAALLSSLRAVAATARADSAGIRRATLASDGQGGSTETWATVATVSCYVTAATQTPDEPVIGDRLAGRTPFAVYLPYDADVRASDRIVVGATTYEVIAVLAPVTDLVHTRTLCAREG